MSYADGLGGDGYCSPYCAERGRMIEERQSGKRMGRGEGTDGNEIGLAKRGGMAAVQLSGT